tara:strand:+ start:132 stop:1811 length:1680 start_codon:yes stop_codon:yes gene_type:complete
MLKDYFEVPNKPAIKSGNVLSCDFTDHETFIPQPLDFTRNTLATYVDCNGIIKYSGITNNELVINGNFDTDTDWNLTSNAVIANGFVKLDSTFGVSYSRCRQNTAAIINLVEITFTIKSNNGIGTMQIRSYNGVNTTDISNLDVGTHIVYTNFTNQGISFQAGSGRIIEIDNVSVKQIDLNTPRIDYTTEIGKAKELQKPSLLLEPQSTNKFIRSEDFSNSYWNKSNCTVQQSTITSPDGLQSSYKLIPDAGTGGNRSLGRNLTGLSNFHTFSFFARAGEYKYAILRTRNNPSVVVSFDLENGTFNVNQSSALYVTDSAKMENYGNGWYRCSITLDPSQSNTVGQLFPSVSVGITGNETNDFDGDGISGIYVFGAQLEEQNYSTSYIPTNGSTITRNGEVCDNAGQRGVFNEEGTIYVEFTELGFTNPNQSSIGVSQDSSSNNRLLLFRGGGSNWSFQVRAASVNIVSNSINLTTTETLNKFAKVAIRYKSGEITAFVNGSQSFTNSSTFTFNGKLDKFGFVPYDSAVTNTFYGRVKDIKVFRRTLTDSEMTELTNNIT